MTKITIPEPAYPEDMPMPPYFVNMYPAPRDVGLIIAMVSGGELLVFEDGEQIAAVPRKWFWKLIPEMVRELDPRYETIGMKDDN